MVLQASTLRKKLQNIEQISQKMRENVDSDSTSFNSNYAEYRKERKSIFADWQVDKEMMNEADKDAVFKALYNKTCGHVSNETKRKGKYLVEIPVGI